MKESINKNIKNITAGVLATAGSLGIHSGVEAQIFKHKDKEPTKKEQQDKVGIEKQDSIIHNFPGDEGFKYPFDKIYKSDSNFYRVVAYGQSIDQATADHIAMSNADMKLSQEINQGNVAITKLSNKRILEEKLFFNAEKKLYTYIVAIEMSK